MFSYKILLSLYNKWDLWKKLQKVTNFKARKSIINCDYMSPDKFEKLHEMVKSMTAAQLTELLILFCAKS